MKQSLLALLGLNLLVWPGIASTAPPPISDSVTVLASVCAPGAGTPVITSPVTGSTVTEAVVMLSGTGSPNETVTIYRNTVVAGATAADGTGNFSLPVTLLPGLNSLVAQGCTQSLPAVVTYTPSTPTPTPQPPPPAFRPIPPQPVPNPDAGSPDLINVVINPEPAPSDAGRGSKAFHLQTTTGVVEGALNQMIDYPFLLYGGTGPFQIRVQTGDGYSMVTVATERSLLLKHSYEAVGRYLVTIEAIDAEGRQAFLQGVIVVTHDGLVATARQPSDGSGRALALIFALELLVLAALFAIWEYYLRNRHAHP